MFTKVVCVVFSSVLCFCIVQILDLDHRANFFSFFFSFFLTFFHSHSLFSFLFSFVSFFFPFLLVSCLVVVSSPCVTSSYLVASSYCFLTLPRCYLAHSLVASLPSSPHYLIALSSLLHHRCFVALVTSSPHYLITLVILLPHRPHCCHATLLFCCYLVAPPCWVEVPSNPPNLLLRCLTPCCLATLLLHYFCCYFLFPSLPLLVLPSSLFFCKEELRAWKNKLSNNKHKFLKFYLFIYLFILLFFFFFFFFGQVVFFLRFFLVFFFFLIFILVICLYMILIFWFGNVQNIHKPKQFFLKK